MQQILWVSTNLIHLVIDRRYDLKKEIDKNIITNMSDE
jgi:hypothetical protein